jgi:hypothetical protein
MLRSPGWAWFWSFFRIVVAGAAVAAVVAQLVRSTSIALNATEPYAASVPTVLWNFVSFFTIDSNILAAVTMAIGAVLFWTRGRKDASAVEPRWFAVLLACATTYMVITGIVYNTLLRGYALQPGAVVIWSNELLHVWVPVAMALDLLVGPRRRGLPWRDVWFVVIFPIVWVIYTMIRAPFITSPSNGEPFWYPYPFLNPNNALLVPPGWAGVAVYIVGIAVAIIAAGFLVIWIGRLRARTSAAPELTPSAAATR